MKPGQDRINSKPSKEWDPTFVPAFGEICINVETGQYKYGDGVTPYASLPLSSQGFATKVDVAGALAAISNKVDATQVTAIATDVAKAIVSSAIANMSTKPAAVP